MLDRFLPETKFYTPELRIASIPNLGLVCKSPARKIKAIEIRNIKSTTANIGLLDDTDFNSHTQHHPTQTKTL